MLCHPGIYLFGSPVDTGNFVPASEKAPEGIPQARMCVPFSWMCQLALISNFVVNEKSTINANCLGDLILHRTKCFTSARR